MTLRGRELKFHIEGRVITIFLLCKFSMDNTTLGMFVHVILQTCSSYTIKDCEDQLFCESRFREF